MTDEQRGKTYQTYYLTSHQHNGQTRAHVPPWRVSRLSKPSVVLSTTTQANTLQLVKPKKLCVRKYSVFFFLLLFHFTDLNERSDVFFFPHILRDSGCFSRFPWCAAGKKLLHCACLTFDPCVFVVFCRVLVCQSLFVKPVSLITFL